MSVTTDVKPFAWSYSQLNNYETCPRRHQAYSVTKEVVEPESDAIRQGKLLHAAFEKRVATGEKLPLGMGMYESMLAKLASAPGLVNAEQRLALSATFEPVAWFARPAWFRQIIDYSNIREDGLAIVIDYKTGKPKEDLTQLQLSAATVFAHDPSVSQVRTAMLFVGYDHIEPATFTRADLPAIWAGILPRVKRLEEARAMDDFPPNPGPLCRRYCGVRSCAFWGK
jgi:hypothetical protein